MGHDPKDDDDEPTRHSSPELRAWQQKLRELESSGKLPPKTSTDNDPTNTAVTQPKPPTLPHVNRPTLRPRGALPPPTLPPRTNTERAAAAAAPIGTHTFARLPDELRGALVASGQLLVLADGDPLPAAAAYHVLAGEVSVHTAHFSGVRLGKGAALLARGTLDGPAPQLRARGEKTTLVCWPGKTFAEAIGRYPWVEVDLRQTTDRVLAICGAAEGPLARTESAHYLDTIHHFELLVLAPGELLLAAGTSFPGLCVVGAGSIEIDASREAPGSVLFPMMALQGAPAPRACRAGPQGALVLVALAGKARELAIAYQPLREILQAAMLGP